MQHFLTRLFTRLMKSWSWVLLIISAIAVKWISLYPDWVEKYYTYGIYPVISKVQRILFGWIPFSIGDLFYGFLILVIILKTFQFFKLLFRKKLNKEYFIAGLQQFIFFFLFVYVFFNLLWGLNYNRLGIASQLNLDMKKYTVADLDSFTTILQKRLNEYAPLVDKAQRDSFAKKKKLFNETFFAFSSATMQYPFLKLTSKSIKPSLYSYAGNYLGFQGYYNPFSGEGQVNTTIPGFLEPYVAMHEMAHQAGYAKENEANFVAFLACRNYSSNILFYSLYFNLYTYSIVDLWKKDSVRAGELQKQLHPQEVKDLAEMRKFYKKYENPVEPVINWLYGHFLKANNQPGGKKTYNEVVALMIAYYKKYGLEEL